MEILEYMLNHAASKAEPQNEGNFTQALAERRTHTAPDVPHYLFGESLHFHYFTRRRFNRELCL